MRRGLMRRVSLINASDESEQHSICRASSTGFFDILRLKPTQMPVQFSEYC
jgi:hypothetical protein